MIGILGQQLISKEIDVKFLTGLKVLCYSLLTAGVGFVLGDEIGQRLERANMRAACYEMQATQFPALDDLIEMSIRYKCRVNIP
jgi:hypothetical protein